MFYIDICTNLKHKICADFPPIYLKSSHINVMILICIKIFFARILDVSLGTIKTFYVLKEKKIIAFIISFIELIIWYYAARTALSLDVSSILIPISYLPLQSNIFYYLLF